VPEDTWYSPRDITKFTPDQIIWLIPLLPLLRSGFYPLKPAESGYTDSPISKRKVKAQAGFIVPTEIATELDSRLESAGLEGVLLELISTIAEMSSDVVSIEIHIAQALGKSFEEIENCRLRALRYVSGPRPKKRDYKQWKQHKKASRK